MKWIAPSHYNSQRRQALFDWHRYFAWRPVFIDGAKYDNLYVPAHFVWLEYVDRKMASDWKDAPLLGHLLVGWMVWIAPSIKWDFRPYTNSEPVWARISSPSPISR